MRWLEERIEPSCRLVIAQLRKAFSNNTRTNRCTHVSHKSKEEMVATGALTGQQLLISICAVSAQLRMSESLDLSFYLCQCHWRDHQQLVKVVLNSWLRPSLSVSQNTRLFLVLRAETIFAQ